MNSSDSIKQQCVNSQQVQEKCCKTVNTMKPWKPNCTRFNPSLPTANQEQLTVLLVVFIYSFRTKLIKLKGIQGGSIQPAMNL